MAPSARPADVVLYRERLGAPLWLLLIGLVVAATLGWTIGAGLGLWLGVAVGLAGGALLAWSELQAPEVAVTASHLRAGRASLPLDADGRADGRVVGRVVALDAERTARLRGPESDHRAYLLLRGWLRESVLVEVIDERDPAPYWQVSTRRPQALAAAISAAIAALGGSEHRTSGSRDG